MKRISIISILCLAVLSMAARPKYITYEKFGAKGDGVTDDMPAIVAAHAAANEKGLPVRAKNGRTYFIGNASLKAEIRTDTDFGTASFIIDDVGVEEVRTPIFLVAPDKKDFKVKGVQSLMRGQDNLGVELPCRCLVEVMDKNHKVFIRKGLNRNNGTDQRDVLIVNEDGSIDPSTPVVFDFANISSVRAYPVNEKPITIKGGTFTTIANQDTTRRIYYHRGIQIRRSGTTIEGVTHLVTGEGDQGAPYSGFICVDHAADVVISDCIFTGHKTYITYKFGKPVSKGTYDTNATSSVNIFWKNCRQTNDIDNPVYWGVFTSNFCKVLKLENCSFSRFDAHQSVTNVSLKNCTFGHQNVRMVGFGTILMEDCEIHGNDLMALRQDYGSTWDGDIIVRRCTLKPYADDKNVYILSGSNDGSHDFGYPCQLPSSITVEGLVIEDEGVVSKEYRYPTVLSAFGRTAGIEEPFPYSTDCKVVLKDVTVKSGKPLKDAPNPAAFRGLTVQRID